MYELFSSWLNKSIISVLIVQCIFTQQNKYHMDINIKMMLDDHYYPLNSCVHVICHAGTTIVLRWCLYLCCAAKQTR